LKVVMRRGRAGSGGGTGNNATCQDFSRITAYVGIREMIMNTFPAEGVTRVPSMVNGELLLKVDGKDCNF
jgi:hypothetical protein